MLDLLIKNVTIVDGTGNPRQRGNIAVQDGKIVAVGKLSSEQKAARVIDASGMIGCPGFIDIHRHGDLIAFQPAPSEEEIRQGITTFFSGNCGFSPFPSSKEQFNALQKYARPILGPVPELLQEASFAEFVSEVAARGLPSNAGYFVGNGALRIAVKGFDASPMTDEEMTKVCTLLEREFDAGAFALSLGLMYVPENFYSTKELVEICTVAAKKKRLVAVHMRGEGSSLLDSIDEILTIARQSGASFHISHLKAAGKKNWHTLVPKALKCIQDAQQEGLDISFDCYPYIAGSTALYTLLPPAAMQGGIENTLLRLQNAKQRKKIASELRQEQESWDNLIASTGWASVIIAGGDTPALVGQSIADIARKRNCSGEDCMMDLLLENKGDIPIVFYSMCEEDMGKILQTPGAIVISDALYSQGGLPHPRKFGSQAKFISHYGRKIGLEKAVQAVTSLPAKRMGLTNRGSLLPGMQADIVLFASDEFKDTATFAQPFAYPAGIKVVIVNGKIALNEQGEFFSGLGQLLLAENNV